MDMRLMFGAIQVAERKELDGKDLRTHLVERMLAANAGQDS